MTQEEFNVVFELQMRKCADILAHKKKEYTSGMKKSQTASII